jgi:hypothetical protein
VPYIESLRHVIKNSMGVTYCIWYKNGLFMSMLESNNHWGPPFLLSENATSDFSSVVDEEDTIRTAFVDYAGRLLYIGACQERKDPVVILESRIVGSAPYNVTLAETMGCSNVFYIVSHNRKQLLTYQRIEGGSLSMPEVQGVVVRDSMNYTVCHENSNLHLFFLTEIQDVNLIVHRRIGSDGKSAKPNSAPFPYKVSKRLQSVMTGGTVYILASNDESSDSTILFKYDTETDKFSKGLEVFNLSTSKGFDSLIAVDGYPAVIRTCNDHFLLSRIKQDASASLGETRIDMTGTNPPIKCVYHSRSKDDTGFVGGEIPIIFGSGLRFPFDWRMMVGSIFERRGDEKSLLQERMRELEGRIEFLENAMREILRP